MTLRYYEPPPSSCLSQTTILEVYAQLNNNTRRKLRDAIITMIAEETCLPDCTVEIELAEWEEADDMLQAIHSRHVH